MIKIRNIKTNENRLSDIYQELANHWDTINSGTEEIKEISDQMNKAREEIKKLEIELKTIRG